MGQCVPVALLSREWGRAIVNGAEGDPPGGTAGPAPVLVVVLEPEFG